MTLSPDAIAEDDGSSLAPPSGVLGAHGVSFHDVVDALDQLVVILSATGDAKYVNRAGREYLGLDLAEARTRWRASIHTEDIGPTVMARGMDLATAAPWSMQVRMRRHDGVYRWFRARVTPLRDLAGAITHWTAAFTDVDDTHALGDRLRVEEERLAALDGVMPGALFTFRQSADGAVSFPFVSLRFSGITGVPVEAIRADAGAAFAAIVPEDLPKVMTSIEESRRTLSPWRQVFRARHWQHGLVWIEGHSSPRRDADGGTTWHGALHDETAREQALAETQLWADAFRHCSDGLVISNPKTMKIVSCNKACSTLLGYSEAELVGSDIASFHLGMTRAGVARSSPR